MRKIVINTSVNVCYNSSVKPCGLVLLFWSEVLLGSGPGVLYIHAAAELDPRL